MKNPEIGDAQSTTHAHATVFDIDIQLCVHRRTLGIENGRRQYLANAIQEKTFGAQLQGARRGVQRDPRPQKSLGLPELLTRPAIAAIECNPDRVFSVPIHPATDTGQVQTRHGLEIAILDFLQKVL